MKPYAQKTATEIELENTKVNYENERAKNAKHYAEIIELRRQLNLKTQAVRYITDEMLLYKVEADQYRAENQRIKSELAVYKRAEIKSGMIRQTEGEG